MSRLPTLVALALAGITFAASPAIAQQTHPQQIRKGFWFSGGLGYGSLGCNNCGTRTGGFSSSIALGGTLSRQVQIGVGTSVWIKSQNGATLTVGTLDFRVRLYPSATSGFFFTGGLGGGTISASASASGFGTVSASENGVGAVFGIGYDIPLSPSVSLSPYLNGVAIRASNSDDANFGQFGLAITVH